MLETLTIWLHMRTRSPCLMYISNDDIALGRTCMERSALDSLRERLFSNDAAKMKRERERQERSDQEVPGQKVASSRRCNYLISPHIYVPDNGV